VTDKTKVTGYRFPFPGADTNAENGKGYAFMPAQPD
jgi:hypothetical protein